MAQTIKLKRSATQGKVPSTGNLSLGEIAINTYDGRVFLKKNDGSDSIQHVVVTDSITTGSITIFGNISGSWNGHVIDKQYLDDEILNTSLNTFTQSAITITGNGTSGSVAVFNDTHEVTNATITSVDGGTIITHDNDTNIIFTVSGSNGELLTITDSNTGNLLEVNDASGIDVFTVSAVGDVSASGAITASDITGLTSLNVNGNIYGTSFNGTGLVSGSVLRPDGDGIVSESAQIDAQSATNPAAIYDNSGTPTLRSGITQGELQTAIGVDAAGTKNSTDVTLGGSYDYITAGGTDNQTLTLGQIDLTTDVTGVLPSANLDTDTAHLSGTQTFTGTKTFNASGNSIIIGDTLRIDEDGSGLRMTNVGAFESASEGFHIFSNGNLRLSTNGSGAGTTAVIFDQTTKDATFEGNILAGNISGSSFNGTGLVSGSSSEVKTFLSITSADISDVDAFSQSGNYSGLRAQATTAGDVGLGNVTNESKSTMFTDAALTGTPTAPTADTDDNTTQIATTEFVKAQNYLTSADGGNATTLDGIDSSGFIRANADDDVSAHTEWQDSKEIRLGSGNDAQLYHNGTNMFLANGTGNLIIRNNTDNGNVVLQSDNGSGGVATYLYLDGTNEKVQIDKPTDISDTTQSTSKTTGALVVDGGVGIAKTLNVGEDVVAFASSDERYKDNVTPIENPNEKLKQIGGYTFDWNDKHEVFKGQHDVGVIAQEIEKVLPEIVETRESGYKAVKYEKIVALLIESNKELLKRIEDLESKIN